MKETHTADRFIQFKNLITFLSNYVLIHKFGHFDTTQHLMRLRHFSKKNLQKKNFFLLFLYQILEILEKIAKKRQTTTTTMPLLNSQNSTSLITTTFHPTTSSSVVSAGAAFWLLNLFPLFTKLLTSLNLVCTLPIYIALLVFLCRQRQRAPFNSSFYRLFVALGVVDISKYVLYLVKKCSYWGYVFHPFLPLDAPNGMCCFFH